MRNHEVISDIATASMKGFNQKKFWRRAFGIYILAEAVYWTLHYLNINMYDNCTSCVRPVAYYIVQWFLNLLFTGLLWYFLNKFYHKSRLAVILINMGLFIIHYAGWIWVNYHLHKSGPSWLIGDRITSYLRSTLLYDSWFDIGKYVLKMTAFYVLKFYAEYRNSEQQRLQLTIINKDLQLNLLKQQLSPHFYFNTLNNLYGLARSNNEKLSAALQQLSNIMHYVIVECNRPKVSLHKEIDFLQSYIALEKLRYEEHTVIDMHVEGNADGHTIMPLLLIQFVENAFKHGMKEKSEQNWMRVDMHIRETELTFSVANSFYSPPAMEGIGLSSVNRRLDLQYEGKYDMQMISIKDRFSVTLKLNLT